ncbi:MAG TPA: prepilin-type N-terminal cleavage/methylation domain-containing protein [Verrucomicrobiae bacterium]
MRIGNVRTSDRRAFTLIELILVMALLVIVVSLTFPDLRKFFRGRTLESEGRRFLTLTRYGQNRAATEGIPMTLWIDPIQGSYGLEAQKGFLDKDDRAVEYNVDEKLDIEIAQTGWSRAELTMEQQTRRRTVGNTRNSNAEIRFAPDGSVDVMSPQSVCIREASDKQHALWVTLAENRNAYEVENNAPQRR